MVFLIFGLLFGLPILEIFVFVQAGGSIGWLNVLLLTILTAVLGTAIIRWQGLQALADLRQAMADGRPPVAPVVDGIFLLMAAPLLMTPGFVTDACGFLLLVPQVRHTIARWALGKIQNAVKDGKVTIIRQR